MSFKPRWFGIAPKLMQMTRIKIRSIMCVPDGKHTVTCRMLHRAVIRLFYLKWRTGANKEDYVIPSTQLLKTIDTQAGHLIPAKRTRASDRK
jgi:hypothetical protein